MMSQINIWRFTWYFPWAWDGSEYTKIHKASDEWHNKSSLINLPFLGCFCWFTTWNGRKGKEHLYAYQDDKFWGFIDPDCEICQDILEVHKEG